MHSYLKKKEIKFAVTAFELPTCCSWVEHRIGCVTVEIIYSNIIWEEKKNERKKKRNEYFDEFMLTYVMNGVDVTINFN